MQSLPVFSDLFKNKIEEINKDNLVYFWIAQ